MPQTTDGLSSVNAVIEIAIQDAVPTLDAEWTDISGESNTIDAGEQSRMSGETYTFDGDTAIITTGKREPVEVTLNIVYTEVVDSPYDELDTAFKANTKLHVRWFPKGFVVGNYQFSMSPAWLTALTEPGMDAGSPDPLMVAFTIKAPEATRGVYVAAP